jgi:hypothetical protein
MLNKFHLILPSVDTEAIFCDDVLQNSITKQPLKKLN